MDKEDSSLTMEIDTKDSIRMESLKETVHTFGEMDRFIKDNLKMD